MIFSIQVTFLSKISDDHLDLLIQGLNYQAVREHEVVCYEGDAAEDFYIVYSGEVEIFRFAEVADNLYKVGDPVSLGFARSGNWFGEMALVMDTERTATVITKDPTLLLKISRSAFQSFLKCAKLDINEVMRSRIIQSFKAFNIPFFQAIPESKFAKIAQACTIMNLQPGQTVFAQGDEGDKFYIVSRGLIIVQKDRKELVRIGSGSYFGEVALVLEECPRTATCVAAKKTTLLSMSKENFRGFFENNPEALADVELKIAGEKAQIRSVIYHSKAKKIFMKYLEDQLATESLFFWEDVRRFRKEGKIASNPTQIDQLKKRAKYIIDTYISANSENPVNISSNQQTEILTKFESGNVSHDMFVRAETEIVRLLDRDKFYQFKRSEEFHKFLVENGQYQDSTNGGKNSIRRGGSLLLQKKANGQASSETRFHRSSSARAIDADILSKNGADRKITS
ncbi:hypothetical protein AAMO2058_000618700 [Amorphochlora amoebiformis]